MPGDWMSRARWGLRRAAAPLWNVGAPDPGSYLGIQMLTDSLLTPGRIQLPALGTAGWAPTEVWGP
jgi:hypothetical protein